MSAPTAAQPKRTRKATPAAKQAKENKDNRGRGSRYSDANLSIMLDLADEHLPAGGDEWNNAVLLYNQHFGNGEDRTMSVHRVLKTNLFFFRACYLSLNQNPRNNAVITKQNEWLSVIPTPRIFIKSSST